jgi:hypothetical protein
VKPVVFIYSHDAILQDVKQESSHLAVRKRDKEGFSLDKEDNSYFEMLVFDEAYLIKFRELFFDAQSEVTSAVSAYLKDVPAFTKYLEEEDFRKDRDYTFALALPDDFNFHMVEPVNVKIRQYLIAYILFRWLETKLPEEASVYLERAIRCTEEIKKLLEHRTKPVRRWHGYW